MIKQRITITAFLLVFFSFPSISLGNTGKSGKNELRTPAAFSGSESTKALSRWKHAKELLGKSYRKNITKSGDKFPILDQDLYRWTEKALKPRWKKYSRQVAQSIIQESDRYGFDPIFLMAVIRSESSFNPEVVGRFGEIGLMQLTPQTAEWITEKYHLAWKGPKSLKDPATNIKIGAAYMAYLRGKFAFKSQLYIAAYNMGSTNVHRALARQLTPRVYPSRVMGNYLKYYASLSNNVNASH